MTSIDPAESRRHLELVHGTSPGLISIVSSNNWAGHGFDSVSAAADHAARLAEAGHDVYFGVGTLARKPASGRGSAADTLAFPGCFVDLDMGTAGHATPNGLPLPPDVQAALDTIKHLPEPTLIVYTGGGLHVYWLLAEPVILNDTNRAEIADLSRRWQEPTIERAAGLGYHVGQTGDLARVLRVAGTINFKVRDLPRPVSLDEHIGPRYTPDELQAALDALRGRETPAAQVFRFSQPASGFTGATGPNVWDLFEQHVPFRHLFEQAGWAFVRRERDGCELYRRPGHPTSEYSARVGYGGRNLVTVHSDAAGLPYGPGNAMSPGRLYAALHHHGNMPAARRDLILAAHGDPAATPAARSLPAAALTAIRDATPGASTTSGCATSGASSGSGTDGEQATTRTSYFGRHGLLVAALAADIRAEVPMALSREGTVAAYQGGVYRIGKHKLKAVCADRLGDRYRPAHLCALESFLEGQLWREGRELPEPPGAPLLNVRNGLLDLRTGELSSHDPSWLSVVQFPIVWDPAAVCPTYDRWVTETFTFTDGEGDRVSQVEDLEECFSTMLDPSTTPTKAPYLYGPSRTGKSTLLRIAAAIAGPANVSAVTLHQLSQNRFAAANLYGKVLNCAADMSGAHVEDLSVFKMMTGQDPIHADRKYGGQFTFTNVALFAFSANELVTVGESSRAYVERIKPFRCDNIIAGREDPGIEAAMMSELPGILVRWVRAWMRRRARGRYLPTHPVVQRELETAADRVRLWVDDRCHVHPAGPGERVPPHRMTGVRGLQRAFNTWVEAQGGHKLQERRFRSRLLNVPGVYEVRSDRDGARGLNLKVKLDWDD